MQRWVLPLVDDCADMRADGGLVDRHVVQRRADVQQGAVSGAASADEWGRDHILVEPRRWLVGDVQLCGAILTLIERSADVQSNGCEWRRNVERR